MDHMDLTAVSDIKTTPPLTPSVLWASKRDELFRVPIGELVDRLIKAEAELSTRATAEIKPAEREHVETAPRTELAPAFQVQRCPGIVHSGILARISEAGATALRINVDVNIVGMSFLRMKLIKMIGISLIHLLNRPVPVPWSMIHTKKLLVFPQLDWNPHLPQQPGEPGALLLAQPHTEENPQRGLTEPFPLFVKLGQASYWTYMGEYRYIPMRHLTAAEFFDLPKAAWRSRLRGYLEAKWGERLRISLRNKLRRSPTIRDLETAIRNGEEAIQIGVLNCVAYDESFQRTLVKKSKMPDEVLEDLRDETIRVMTRSLRPSSPTWVDPPSTVPQKRARTSYNLRRMASNEHLVTERSESPTDDSVDAYLSGERMQSPVV